MENEQLLRSIGTWQSRVTGLPEQCFEGLDLQEKLDAMAQWHASKMVAEQVLALLVAQTMVEDDVTVRGLAAYLGCREARAAPLGRFNFVSGIAEWPGNVNRVFLPLLRSGGYRPFLRYDTAKAILDLCRTPGLSGAGLQPGDVADTIYRRGLSPSVAKRSLKTLAAFAKSDPEAARSQLEGLMAAREQAVPAIADLPDIDERIEELEGSMDAASAGEGSEPA